VSYESEPLDLELVGARTGVWAKDKTPQGAAPAIALINPRYAHNVGGAVRAASCFGAKQVWWTGERVQLDAGKGQRLPREERMKGYKDVTIVQYDHVFDQFGPDVTPVAVELRENAEPLPDFVHPQNALYVFGPEDGSLGKVELIHATVSW
jgi:tRNA(Leu) C34 or U34 (ribose-2'-O)-methylase TrmL